MITRLLEKSQAELAAASPALRQAWAAYLLAFGVRALAEEYRAVCALLGLACRRQASYLALERLQAALEEALWAHIRSHALKPGAVFFDFDQRKEQPPCTH